ncbi:MAG: YIP1 family protein [Nitrosopumilus sp.]|nr:YIP1 family protein [Nitrosopumilus sp.]MDH3384639.1 YIP1 family protein [Nitrosopumilus sp.]
MFYFDLSLILRVFISPNSAFLQVRDNEEKYFSQSIALLIISSVLGGLAVLPFVMMPLDDAYFEIPESENIDETFPLEDSAVGLSIISSLLSGFVSAILYYFIGKKLDGNTNWKKVFSVIFHIHAIVIPITIIMAMLLFLMWGSFTSIDSSILLDPNNDDEEVFSLLGSFIGYVLLLAIVGISFAIWGLIVTIKAIKVVHGFGTGKAFGLIILVGTITSLVSIPFSFG